MNSLHCGEAPVQVSIVEAAAAAETSTNSSTAHTAALPLAPCIQVEDAAHANTNTPSRRVEDEYNDGMPVTLSFAHVAADEMTTDAQVQVQAREVVVEVAAHPTTSATIINTAAASASIMTISVHKRHDSDNLGFQIEQPRPPHGPLLVAGVDHEINNENIDRLFESPTLWNAGQMQLVAINGCPCSDMSVDEARILVASTPVGGAVTLEMALKQDYDDLSRASVLYNDDNQQAVQVAVARHPNRPAVAATVEAVPTGSTTRSLFSPYLSSSTSSFDTPPSSDMDNCILSNTTKKTITVLLRKPRKTTASLASSSSSFLGLTFGNEPQTNGTVVPVITHVDPRGAWRPHQINRRHEPVHQHNLIQLQRGMRVLSVNGLHCANKKDVQRLLQRTSKSGLVQLELLHLDQDVENGHDENRAVVDDQVVAGDEDASLGITPQFARRGLRTGSLSGQRLAAKLLGATIRKRQTESSVVVVVDQPPPPNLEEIDDIEFC